MSGIVRSIRSAVEGTAVLLAHTGLIDEERGKRIADLAWPRVITGLARKSQSTADLAMVGIAIGPAAIAGLGFAFAFWMMANAFGWSFANGAMTFFSQRFGAGDEEGLDLAIKQTLWIELVVSTGLAVVLIAFAEPLIGMLGADPTTLAYGTTYLRVAAVAMVFNVVGHIATRVFLCANDAWSPMAVRAVGAVGNIVLNAIFIFGLGMGVFGAALGTLIASVAIAGVLVFGLVTGWLPFIGALPVKVSLGPPYFDYRLSKQIVEVGVPLVGKRIVSRAAIFVMLAIVASFGTVFVAAYAVAREIRQLMNTPSWGFGTASRSLVGQRLGNDEEVEAEAYGWDILKFTAVVFVLMATTMFAFAGNIAPLFTNDPLTVDAAVPFIMAMAVSLLGLGVDSAASGNISAAGDTRWPLYARLVGYYVFMIPIAYLGTVTPIGVVALYVAVLAETFVPALITLYRFNTGKWIDVSVRYRSAASD